MYQPHHDHDSNCATNMTEVCVMTYFAPCYILLVRPFHVPRVPAIYTCVQVFAPTWSKQSHTWLCAYMAIGYYLFHEYTQQTLVENTNKKAKYLYYIQ